MSNDLTSLDQTQCVFRRPPEPVGYWCLGSGNGYYTQFAMWKKPTDEQIKNHYEMLGWVWRNAT